MSGIYDDAVGDFLAQPPAAPAAAAPAPAQAAPAPASDPYCDAVGGFLGDQASQAQQATFSARGVQPDAAARAQQLSAELGVPAAVVEQDPQTYEQRASLYRSNAALKQDPALAAWIAANPESARVARDDYDHMSLVGKISQGFSQGWSGAVESNAVGRAAFAGDPAAQAMGADMQRRLQVQDAVTPSVPGHIASAVGGLLGGWADMASKSYGAAAAGGVAGSVLPGVGTAAGLGVGMVAGMVADGFKVGYGSTKLSLSNQQDANGNHIDAGAQEGASIMGGLVFAGLNAIGAKAAAGPAANALKSVVTEATTRAMARPTVAQAASSLAANIGKGALTGGVLGAGTEGANVLFEQAARAASSGDFTTILNDPGQREAAVQRIEKSMVDMALGVGALHGAGAFGGFASDLVRAKQSASDRATFAQLEQGAADSTVRGRSPDTFSNWVGSQMDGSPVDSVYVPAGKVRELYQSIGAEPGENDGLLGRAVPDVAEQLAQAEPIGGDVVIPAKDYLAHLAGTDVSKKLQPDLRFRADGMSMSEEKAANDQLSASLDQMRQEHDAQQPAGAEPTGADAVHADVRDQLRSAGFVPAAAEANASLMAARYATRGDMLGMDPAALYKEDGFRIQATDQPGPDGQRGSIKLSDGSAIMSLFNARDLSTPLHEFGHLFLDQMGRDAGHENAPQQLKDDFAAVLGHVGATSAEGIGTDGHEKFAKSFEAYLMDGKPPSAALSGPFSRFRSWLVSIYSSIRNVGGAVSPEMREVFDRMLATDSELADTRRRQSLDPMFADARTAGMTDAEFAAYRENSGRAWQDASGKLLEKTMATIRRREQAAWKKEASAVREEVAPSVDARPELQYLKLLRDGVPEEEGGAPERFTMDRDGVHAIAGDEGIAAIEDFRRGILKDGGVDPDEAAEAVGLRAGDDLVARLLGHADRQRELRASGDPRSVRDFDIDQATNEEMVRRHGDPLSDGSIHEEALRSLLSEKQGSVLAAEARALARAKSDTPIGRGPSLADVRAFAKDAISGKSVRNATNVGLYARLSARAGRAAFEALGKGDRLEAVRQKRLQLLNHELAREAENASREVDKSVGRLSDYAEGKGLGSTAPDYVEQIKALLDRFSFSDASGPAVQRSEALRAFVERKRAEGEEPKVPDELMDEAFRTHYSRLPLEQLRGLDDAARSLAHLGRLKTKLRDGKELREFNAVVDEAVAQAGQLPQRETSNVLSPHDGGTAWEQLQGKLGKALSAVRTADAALLKIEQMVQWLDRKDPTGVYNRQVFRKLADAQGAKSDMELEYAGKLRDIGKGFPEATRKQMTRRITMHELLDEKGRPYVMQKQEVLALALNMGTESNLDKLTRGYGWTPDQVRAATDRVLSAGDWKQVQAIWDTVNSLWPRIAEQEKRLSGVEPDRVEARQVETAHGTFDGGYYPVIYDPRKQPARAVDPDALFSGRYVRAKTDQGHTEARTKYAAPMLLSLDALPGHIGQVIHDLTHREAIMDVAKFLQSPRVVEAMKGALGDEKQAAFYPWLRDIANEKAVNAREMSGWDAFARKARLNTTMVGIGFRTTTMAKHGLTALGNSIGEVGALPFASAAYRSALSAFSKDPDGAVASVMRMSAEMRHRISESDRDMRDIMAKDVLGVGKTEAGVAAIRRYSMMGVAMLDLASAVPTWLAAYEGHLKKGLADEDAIYAADQVVRNAHGAGGMKDLSAMQRGSETWKLGTMFYGFFNHMYNRTRSLGRDAMAVRSVGDFASVLGRSFFYLLVPSLVETAIVGAPASEDEGWGEWAAKGIGMTLAGTVPVVRDIAASIERGTGYQMSPVADMVKAGTDTFKDIEKAAGDGEPSARWLQHSVKTVGYALGLPTGQASGTAQFLWDVIHGDEAPEGAAEWLRGLAKGPPPKVAGHH